MIDTCDPKIACWSEDGDTFVVKIPDTFEKVIIPQFFKHSKFTSFVRQLNFYGFRKIKFTDTIRIDTALEAQTANFWRFRHENFRQGRPDLLAEIKRSNSTSASDKKVKATKPVNKPQSGGDANKGEDVAELKTELKTLKDRIAMMTTNIDQLTSMVQNVTLDKTTNANTSAGSSSTSEASAAVTVKQEDVVDTIADASRAGCKRKKVDPPAVNTSSSGPTDMVVDSALDMQFTPDTIFPPGPELSSQTNVHMDLNMESDEAFVDELFNALDDGDMDSIIPDMVSSTPACASVSSDMASSASACTSVSSDMASSVSLSPSSVTPIKAEDELAAPQDPNAPDKDLMNKLSDALTILPKDIQEMLVNRLITTVTSSDALKSHLDTVCSLSNDNAATPVTTERWPSPTPMETMTKQIHTKYPEHNPDIALPLAAATLTALMTQWSAAMKDKACVNTNKSIPVIPIHA
mmetsp:Transcript_2711/g.4076  ORF Transcript_2711/g.4076 Transcript_2711/m.4076 type:complete len:464 (+) Transcript_2711:122-1513(+)